MQGLASQSGLLIGLRRRRGVAAVKTIRLLVFMAAWRVGVMHNVAVSIPCTGSMLQEQGRPLRLLLHVRRKLEPVWCDIRELRPKEEAWAAVETHQQLRMPSHRHSVSSFASWRHGSSLAWRHAMAAFFAATR
jgi:hypothetical protein